MNILVIGDSWSSAYVATNTGDIDNDGWPRILGVPTENRQAVSGSTAAQWAADFDGRLTKASQTPADVVILSLLGNDAFAALADGRVSSEEITASLANFRKVLESVRKQRTIVLCYTDPFFCADKAKALACSFLNGAIRWECFLAGVEVFDTHSVLLPHHFDGQDIHPNMDGHEAIAAGLKKIL